MATVIAYVDGFNLYHGLHQAYGRRYLWLDLQHLVQRVRPHDQILAVRYFTAEVKDDPDGLAGSVHTWPRSRLTAPRSRSFSVVTRPRQ